MERWNIFSARLNRGLLETAVTWCPLQGVFPLQIMELHNYTLIWQPHAIEWTEQTELNCNLWEPHALEHTTFWRILARSVNRQWASGGFRGTDVQNSRCVIKQRLVIFHTPIQQSSRELRLRLAHCAAIPAWIDSSAALLSKRQTQTRFNTSQSWKRVASHAFSSTFDHASAFQSSLTAEWSVS